MKRKKYLPLFLMCEERGKLSGDHGLCKEFALNELDYHDSLLDLFKPTMNDSENYDVYPGLWWGGECGEWNDTRRNIILFIAAMNGEL